MVLSHTLLSCPLATTVAAMNATSAAFCLNASPPCHTPSAPPCRLHFATNMGVAGGLLLLASFGAGRFTVDALLAKKKE